MTEFDPHIDTDAFLISINDIRDKYFEGEKLPQDELVAMHNYDKFRLEYLNASDGEVDFERRYFRLQVMANLYPYTDFLDFDKIPRD
ncbi:hypothetical protein K6119_13545 [Paracrocinitomix mangrovi]|uniref:hypothetical protein n=1 Tax=Paracrocinitomix mangrovi TaxID=2862509 RepID=UPI001C8D4EBC|nr:hypothetical protein [Paracrocinitomix mangrovi]UKN00755.1 hypothetical protein K6119_13545 [Paracrocinitomix mangrovi]